MIDTDRDAVKQAIRGARQRAGLTQEQAAATRGYATSTISHWESGQLPKTWDELSRYAHALGQTIVIRFGPDSTKTPPPDWARVLVERMPQLMDRDEVTGMVEAVEGRVLSAIAEGQGELIDAIAARVARDAVQRLREGNDDEELGENAGPPGGAEEPRPRQSP